MRAWLRIAAIAGGLGCWAALQADDARGAAVAPLTGGLRTLFAVAGTAFVITGIWFGLIAMLAIGDDARHMRGLAALFVPAAVVALWGGYVCFRDARGPRAFS